MDWGFSRFRPVPDFRLAVINNLQSTNYYSDLQNIVILSYVL